MDMPASGGDQRSIGYIFLWPPLGAALSNFNVKFFGKTVFVK
jgi:hypothetical protein